MRERNPGIDLFKMLVMYMIILLHVLGKGGILAGCPELSGRWLTAWFFESGAYCAVNSYAMVSGYLMADRRVKYYRIIPLWLQVAFYSVLITAAFALFAPETVGGMEWLRAFTPVTSTAYWYFTAYFALFFFMPALNQALNGLSKRNCTLMVAAAFILFSVLPRVRAEDLYHTAGGYSFLWLAVMYLIGGYIKKYDPLPGLRSRLALLAFAACVCVTALSKYLIAYVSIGRLGYAYGDNLLLSYTSPTIVLAAAFLLMAFSRMKVENRPVSRAAAVLAPATFGVYLIHTQPFVWEYLLHGRFAALCSLHPALMILLALLAALAIFVICGAVELCRMALFRRLGVERRAESLVSRLAGRPDKSSLS